MDDLPNSPRTATDPPGQAPAESVAAVLKSARSGRGYSLDSVCQHTRIPRRYLEALESGRFDELPAPVYLRSFLLSYCEYLEIGFDPLWEKLHPAAMAPAPGASPLPAGAPAEESAPPREHGHPGETPLESSPRLAALVSSAGALLLTLALAVALAVWVAKDRGAAQVGDEPPRPQALLPVRPVVEPRLALVFREEAWISLRGDGALLFAGRAPKNARQEWRARKLLQLRVSHPESLSLTLNGVPYHLPRPDEGGAYRIESP